MSRENDNVIPLNVVYRIVWSNPPTQEDFQSNAERGAELNETSAEAKRLHDGLSVFRTASQARRLARKRPPWLGRGYVARVVIPIGINVRLERTLRSAGHYTMWVDASMALTWVESVEPVTPSKDEQDGV